MNNMTNCQDCGSSFEGPIPSGIDRFHEDDKKIVTWVQWIIRCNDGLYPICIDCAETRCLEAVRTSFQLRRLHEGK